MNPCHILASCGRARLDRPSAFVFFLALLSALLGQSQSAQASSVAFLGPINARQFFETQHLTSEYLPVCYQNADGPGRVIGEAFFGDSTSKKAADIGSMVSLYFEPIPENSQTFALTREFFFRYDLTEVEEVLNSDYPATRSYFIHLHEGQRYKTFLWKQRGLRISFTDMNIVTAGGQATEMVYYFSVLDACPTPIEKYFVYSPAPPTSPVPPGP